MSELEQLQEQAPATTALPEGILRGKAKDLSRIFRILAAKSAGTPPFTQVGVMVDSHAGTAHAEHRNAGGSAGLKAWWTIQGGQDGTLATNDVARLIDYVDGGLFGPEEQISVVGLGGKIELQGARRSARMGAFDYAQVPRFSGGKLVDPFISVSNGCFISTDPSKRPGPNAPWSEWAAKGYAVVHIPLKELATVLTGGELIQKRYHNALVRFTIDEGVSVSVQESRDQTADLVDLGRLETAKVEPGSASDEFAVMYSTAEPFFSTLKLARAEVATLVHHPAEVRINLCYAEDKTEDYKLYVTQTFSRWKQQNTGG